MAINTYRMSIIRINLDVIGLNVLAIGDVVGTAGCQFLREKLPLLKRSEKIDLVIANGENSADGNGITPSSARFLFDSGVDIITAGNHTFRRKECYSLFDECEFLLRPANYPNGTTPGKGYTVYDMGRTRVAVVNLLGTMYLESLDDPFATMDNILQKIDSKIIVLDFHAEATAEKIAMCYYLDGKVSAVFGTHTHVQTADERIFKNGTGYITDVGMTGPYESVLGVKPELAVKKFKEKLPVRFETATGRCKMDCIKFVINDQSGKTEGLKRMEIL